MGKTNASYRSRSRTKYHQKRYHEKRGRSRSRNRKTKNEENKLKMNENEEIESKMNEFANCLESTMNKYHEQVLSTKLSNYYNVSLNARFMIENDDKFRNRMERLKGLNAYKLKEEN